MPGRVNDSFEVEVVDDPKVLASANNGGKPYLKVTFPSGTTVNMSARVARALGGIGESVRNKDESRFGGATARVDAD